MSCIDKQDLERIKHVYDQEGVVCVKNILPSRAAQELEDSARRLPLSDDARMPHRRTACLPEDHELSTVLYDSPDVQKVFRHLHGYEIKPSEFPTEYREYGAHSKGMWWHKDLQMWDKPQVEMVYTVFNEDDQTRFEWESPDKKIRSISPRQNDMTFVSVEQETRHRVTPLGSGSRGIIKMVGVRPGSVPMESMHLEKRNCPMVQNMS